MGSKMRLFDDETMRDFIVNGYCVLRPDLPKSFHDTIYEKTEAVFAKEGNPGNNLLPRIPEVQKVYDDPAVHGALSSLVGPDYAMHSHRHPHFNGPDSNGGGWHKDSYWGFSKVRDHHPRWVMAMYYPQDVPFEIGPTGAIPGSQYFESQVPRLPSAHEQAVDPDGIGFPLIGEAGTVVVIHFDLWHRAFPKNTMKNRYMFKFQFTRMNEPSEAQWNKRAEELPLGALSDHVRSPIWRQMWSWLSGASEFKATGHAFTLKQALRDSSEEIRMNAAYTLGGLGEEGLMVLLDGLHEEQFEVKRESCYGLTAVGPRALPRLIRALRADNEKTRAYAVYAIGDMAWKAEEAIPALTPLADDSSEFVRRNVADALGQIRAQAGDAVPTLIRLAQDPDPQVRFNAVYGLAKFRSEAAAAIPVLADAFYDENRYVQGHAAIALEQIGTPEAVRALLHQLQTSRWCPVTTKESTF